MRPVNSSSHTLTISGPALLPLQLSGTEAINSILDYRLVLQTPDALAFMGNEASDFPLADSAAPEQDIEAC